MSGRYQSAQGLAGSSAAMGKSKLRDPQTIRLMIPTSTGGVPSLLWTHVGPGIEERSQSAISRLENAGVQIERVATSLFDTVLEWLPPACSTQCLNPEYRV